MYTSYSRSSKRFKKGRTRGQRMQFRERGPPPEDNAVMSATFKDGTEESNLAEDNNILPIREHFVETWIWTDGIVGLVLHFYHGLASYLLVYITI